MAGGRADIAIAAKQEAAVLEHGGRESSLGTAHDLVPPPAIGSGTVPHEVTRRPTVEAEEGFGSRQSVGIAAADGSRQSETSIPEPSRACRIAS